MHLHQIVWLDFDYMNEHYEGEAIPAHAIQNNAVLPTYDIYFNNEYNGTLTKNDSHWTANNHIDKDLARVIGNKLLAYASQATGIIISH